MHVTEETRLDASRREEGGGGGGGGGGGTSGGGGGRPRGRMRVLRVLITSNPACLLKSVRKPSSVKRQ